MNIKIHHPDMDGEIAKVVVDDETRLASTWYIIGRKLFKCLECDLTGPFNDARLKELHSMGFVSTIVPDKQSGGQRVALFCKYYKQFKGVQYQVTPADGKRLKEHQADLTDELLVFYLNDDAMPDNSTTWLFKRKQSIRNLLSYWNEVKQAMVMPSPSNHPNVWSIQHFKTLTGEGITEYHKHLTSLGLVLHRHRDGTIIDYRPATNEAK